MLARSSSPQRVNVCADRKPECPNGRAQRDVQSCRNRRIPQPKPFVADVGGDRTQHVLWRFEHGQLDGLKPKAAVLMIGTNNSNKDDNTEADILEGVTAIVKQIRTRLPDTKLIVLGIFPRGKTFSTQRGKILQVNQALEKLADNKMIFYMDIGSQMIEADGSISTEMMRDALHPGEKDYEIWAAAIEPKLKELL